MSRIRWNDAMDAVITRHRPDTDWTTLGGLLGLNRDTVKARARVLGVPTGRRAGNRLQWGPEMDDALRALRARRLNWPEVAARIGVAITTAQRRYRQLGHETGTVSRNPNSYVEARA